jgi:hypothetical protein
MGDNYKIFPLKKSSLKLALMPWLPRLYLPADAREANRLISGRIFLLTFYRYSGK